MQCQVQHYISPLRLVDYITIMDKDNLLTQHMTIFEHNSLIPTYLDV